MPVTVIDKEIRHKEQCKTWAHNHRDRMRAADARWRRRHLEKKRLADRERDRTKRHGNWRAIIASTLGLCSECSQPIVDDLHEPFGEVRENGGNGNGKMQLRRPVCLACHRKNESKKTQNIMKTRKYPSRYIEDVSREVRECGGWEAWCRKNGIDTNS